MRILITGVPGSGKTTLAQKAAKHYGLEWWNEKEFALKNSMGFLNEENELEIPVKEFQSRANAYLKKHKKVLLEGHTLCEMKLAVDCVVLLKIDPDVLASRLSRRSYSDEKILDNVFCEKIEYCKKNLAKNYPKEMIIEVESLKTPKETFQKLLTKMKKLGIIKTLPL